MSTDDYRARAALAQLEPVALTRPECFGFAMSFLGDPEETEVRRYVEALEARPTIQPEPVAPKLVYRYSPVTVAECGGPCEQGPQYCDCGEIKGEPAPDPVAPTDEELARRFRVWWHYEGSGLPPLSGMDHEEHARRISEIAWANGAYVARYARPAIGPVPVSERWPEFSDCDPFEKVWAFNPVLDHWKLTRINRSIHSHWLPHHALPTPEATDD